MAILDLLVLAGSCNCDGKNICFVCIVHSTLHCFNRKLFAVKLIQFLLKMTFLLVREIFFVPKKAEYAIQKIKDISHAPYLKKSFPQIIMKRFFMAVFLLKLHFV